MGHRIYFAGVFADESHWVRRILSASRRAGRFRRGLLDVSQRRIATTETDCGLVGTPVIVLATLACIPSMNPLWPHGMTELARQESELQTALPLGMSLEQVRGVLNSRKIQFYESAEPSDGVVLQNPATMTAQAGDTVVVSRFDN